MKTIELIGLIALLEKNGVLKTPAIREALLRVDRKHFVPSELAEFAYDDAALPLPGGQTISQPYTVAFMLELLQPNSGDRIMDVGYGSGWQTALLAAIVGDAGKIFAIERAETLCDFGKQNVEKYPELFRRAEFYCQNAEPGLADAASAIGGFDGIIAAAEVSRVPSAWREQLKTGGRMVYPKAGSVFFEMKQDSGAFETEEYPGFAFVPFIGQE